MTKTENLQDLVKYQNLLREASFSNNGIMKKQVIYQINNSFPDIADEVRREWGRLYPRETLKKVNVFDLTPKGTDDNVLYKEDKEELKVSDFMSVLNYGKKFAEAFFGVDSPKTSGYMLAVKTVDLAINHKEVDKPLNKTLHIINDVLTESAKKCQKDEGGKRVLSGFSVLIDLAIDFLVKG